MSVSWSFIHKLLSSLKCSLRLILMLPAASFLLLCHFSPLLFFFKDILRLAHMWEAKQTFHSSYLLFPSSNSQRGKKINQPCSVWVSFSSCDQRASARQTIRGPRGSTLKSDCCTMIQLPYEHEKN